MKRIICLALIYSILIVQDKIPKSYSRLFLHKRGPALLWRCRKYPNVLGCMDGPVIFGRISIGHVSWLTALTTTYLTTLTNYLSSKLQLVPPELSLLTARWCIRDDYKGIQRWTMPENRYFLGYYDLRYVVSKEQDIWWFSFVHSQKWSKL